ncbi:MAG TPA: TonB family protein [Thermoanaerobaculia bacterium]
MEPLPRRFGPYVLTALLGQDALGRVYRARHASGERGFVRLRLLEGPEISEDAVLDAIEENGEIHRFLKNPSIARGVTMDADEGVPYIAWNEDSGRTLDALIVRARERKEPIPIEHALLIAEKIATALDHAYNTTVEGERTLHGLVWPGFVSLSDDGETRLAGFGLAPGLFPSYDAPAFAEQILPYLAPEQRTERRVGRNSDVFSVGAILFQLMTQRLPSEADPLADLREAARGEEATIPPEIEAVLRMALSPAAGRYHSAGEIRREIGKLLFTGRYAPSTFNLAYFVNALFSSEIEEETRERASEAAIDAGKLRDTGGAASMAPAAESEPFRRIPSLPGVSAKPPAPAKKASRGPALVIVAVFAAAVAGALWVLSRRPEPSSAVAAPLPTRVVTLLPPPTPEPSAPTVSLSEAQFKDEVERRLNQELRKLEDEVRRAARRTPVLRGGPAVAPTPAAEIAATDMPAGFGEHATSVTEVPEMPSARPTETPVPALRAAQEGDLVGLQDADLPPKVARVVKPAYPPIALRQKIGGIVVLRVLVSESGNPDQIEVVRGVKGGITEAAVAAVRRWSFEPARKDGVAVKTWTTIPIPFEP